MINTISIIDLDIPQNDFDCRDRYPKFRWVYDLSRLLDAQHVKWSPFKTNELQDWLHNIVLVGPNDLRNGEIYIHRPLGDTLYTEVYISKGEIKLMRHIDPATYQELPTLIGELELRLSAFITLHFHKFTGVVVFTSIGNEIYRAQLHPYAHVFNDTNTEALKLKKRIYKKN